MSRSRNYNLIRNAILNKQQIVAVYKGHRRELCPHAIGTKNGRAQALFVQFGGGSRSGLGTPRDNWRCFRVDGLTNVSVRNGDWHSASNHSRRQNCLDHVDVAVKY